MDPSVPLRSRSRARLWPALAAALAVLSASCSCAKRAADGAEGALERVAAQIAKRPQTPRAALLVGVGELARGSDPGFAPLPGCVNDVERLAELLVEQYGFDPADVVVLRDAEATHEHVVRAFELALLGRARPGAEMLFYFSGHGSRAPLPAADGEGAGELGTTLICHDSRKPGFSGERDLHSFQLASLVRSLERRGANATVVLDACHAGGALRGGGARVRAGPQGTAALDLSWSQGFWPSGVVIEVRDDPMVRMSSVQIAACRPTELAFELDVDYGHRRVPHGALTWYLASELSRAGPDASWQMLVDGTAAAVSTHYPAQRVSASGALDRPPFGAASLAPVGYAARRFTDRTVHVEAGWLQGLRPDSLLELRDRTGRHPLGLARVERATTTGALARTDQPIPAEHALLRAVELARPPGHAPLTVWAAGGLESLLAGQPLVQGGEGEPDLVLTRGLVGPAWLETYDGLPVCEPFEPTAPGAHERVAEALRREVRWRAAFALGLESGPHAPRVVARSPEAIELVTLGGTRILTPATLLEPPTLRAASARVQRRGLGYLGVLFFDVQNTAPHPLFLSVLSVSEDRAVEPVLPLPGRPPVRLLPGEVIPVPVGLELPLSWPLERAMRDRFVFLVTERELNLHSSRMGAVLRGGDDTPALLAALFDETPTRGLDRPTQAVLLAERGYDVTAYDVLLVE